MRVEQTLAGRAALLTGVTMNAWKVINPGLGKSFAFLPPRVLPQRQVSLVATRSGDQGGQDNGNWQRLPLHFNTPYPDLSLLKVVLIVGYENS